MKTKLRSIYFIPVVVSLSVMAFQHVSAQDQKVNFGLQISPLLSWMKPDVKTISSTGNRFGFSYGLMLDYNLTQNYAFSTGLTVAQNGGTLKYDNLLAFKTETKTDTFPANSEVSYRLQYIEIPLCLKLKTNEIGYMTYFGQFGLSTGINIKAKGDIKNGSKDLVDEKINKEVNFLNLGLIMGGGVEYSLGGKTALQGGLYFNNGFVDVTDDKDKAILNYLSLKVGIMF